MAGEVTQLLLLTGTSSVMATKLSLHDFYASL